jgi:hypothetical protein
MTTLKFLQLWRAVIWRGFTLGEAAALKPGSGHGTCPRASTNLLSTSALRVYSGR